MKDLFLIPFIIQNKNDNYLEEIFTPYIKKNIIYENFKNYFITFWGQYILNGYFKLSFTFERTT